MANIKFSAFTQKVVETDVDFLVGYTGADNVRISPSTIGQGVYLPLAGGTMTGNILLEDSVKLSIGTSDDFNMFFNGVDTTLQNITGNLNIINKANDKDITLQSDDGAGGVATYLTLDGSTTDAYFSNPGNVGIGTASPLADLTVATPMSSSRTSILYLDIDGTNTDGGGGEIVFSTSASSGDLTNYNAKVTGTRVSGDGGDSELGFWTTLVSDNVASQQRMVITKEGNVGIGTASPVDKLHLEGGNARIETIGNTDVELILNPYSTALGTIFQWELVGKGSSGNYNFELRKAGNTYITVNSGASGTAGYVGIGTTSPNRELSIGDGTGSPNIQLLASTVGNSRIEFGDTDDTDAGEIQYVHSSNYMQFTTNGTEKMRIDSSGNVGIGTASPNALGFLEKVLNVSAGSSSSTTLSQAGITISGSSDSNDSNDFAYLSFTNHQSTLSADRVAEIRVKKVGTDVDTGEFTFYTANGTSLAEALTINSSQNVGIGTTNPGAKLEVVGSGTAAIFGDGTRAFKIYTDADEVSLLAEGSVPMKFYTSGAEKMRIDSSGNVGIGTSSPAEELTVSGDANITGKLAVGSSGAHPSFAFYNELTAYFNGAVTIDDTLTQSGGGTSSFSGNVGIGTTSPASKLEVDGGDVEVSDSLNGLILKSPDGTRYRVTVANGGTLTVSAA